MIPVINESFLDLDNLLLGKTVNGAQRVNPWSPLHDPPSPKATACSSAWREGRHHAEADDDSIPPRINTGSPAKADELRDRLRPEH